MITGDLKTIRELDRIIGQHCKLEKDSSNKGSKAYTKTYLLNPHGKIRIFFDEREGKGTIKFKNGAYIPVMCGVSAFVLIQVFTLICDTVQKWF